MQQLKWEHGPAPLLRASIERQLAALDTRAQRIPTLVAVRFRRVAAAHDTAAPPGYMYAIDVAALEPRDELVRTMLDSRRPDASEHYDILRVHVTLPVALSALAATGLAGAPMALELVADNDQLLSRMGPANNAGDLARLTAYEPVRETTSADLAGLSAEVSRALAIGVGQQSSWVERPERLLASFGLRAALAAALDAPASPCAALASYYEMLDHPRVAHNAVPVVWYESAEEVALPEQPATRCSVRVAAQTGKSFVFMGPMHVREGQLQATVPHDAATANSEALAAALARLPAAEYLLGETLVGGERWQREQRVEITRPGLLALTNYAVFPDSSEMVRDVASIIARLQKLLADVRTGWLFDLIAQTADAPQPEHIMLARDRSIAEQMFPPRVVDQLRAVVIGAWSFKLFTEGAEGSAFWASYCQHLASRFAPAAQPIVRALVRLDSTRADRLAPRALSQFADQSTLFEETRQLDAALVKFVLPAAGVYARTPREIELTNQGK